ncbi:probable amidase At4g34880 [Eucalyptus grandis]|uniref:probable amidase At4g34880 n=1 Tax=Eucalyptus grandis TaxID=71139 RepID=UPI00192ED536|nr:probable amidase At4g34880 [Eucalyptus grandis]
MATDPPLALLQSRVLLALLAISSLVLQTVALAQAQAVSLEEASAHDLQLAFRQNKLTSTQLTKFYLNRIRRLNPLLRGVIEVNPDALRQADRADQERKAKPHGSLSALHGIPILLKDNIATKDKMNTTAGSFALLGSVVPRDAAVVARLRRAGAVLLGKASLSEWANYRSFAGRSGWCARSGQGKNPYNLSATPCGSSSGSAISVAANMAAVSLGTETDGSILCPSSSNSVVGIKPTLGLTSRGGVIPITPRQDTVGPMCRTVADAVNVLDVIVGFDPYDDKATREASKYIPRGGYKQFLKVDGLKGKRLGIVKPFPFFDSYSGTPFAKAFESHFNTLRKQGAVLVDRLDLADFSKIYSDRSEGVAMSAEFKLALNTYLRDLVVSPVRSLADVIAFNNKHKHAEKTDEYGQDLFIAAQATNGIDKTVKSALQNMTRLSRDGFEKLMRQNKLDALVTPESTAALALAIGGFPGISVPAGYDEDGVPYGICFGGLRGSEPTLIEIAYGFEKATKIRRPPSFLR